MFNFSFNFNFSLSLFFFANMNKNRAKKALIRERGENVIVYFLFFVYDLANSSPIIADTFEISWYEHKKRTIVNK